MSVYSAGRDRQNNIDRLVMDARLLGAARMLRDDQDLTPEITEAIIKRFRETLTRIGKSETWAARSMDIAPSTLSQVLSGNYEGDRESRLRKIDKWTEQQMARESAPRPQGFARTGVALQIIGAAKMAMKEVEGGIAVVHGPSGCGKTLTCEYLHSEVPGSILIRITTAGAGISAIYDMLASALKMPRAGRTAYQTEQAVKQALADHRRLIIVDEVHKLCVRGKDQGLHVLRDLHDMTKCPMLWLGTADIATYLEQGREAVEAVEQIYGRVVQWLDLTYAASRADGGPGLHSVDDVRKCLAAHSLKLTSDAERYATEVANEPKLGNLRSLVRDCHRAAAIAGDKAVTRDLLLDVQADRLGKRAASIVHATIETRNKRKVG